ncbi:MAG: acyl-CoA dehydrogenase [candidate division Zixibacteria bacterium]|nr:acyl-CoA dehydrogenase [candidate division Zixibacteria bacterium]
MMRDAARDFANKRIYPNAEHWDKEGKLPDEIIRELGELGYLGMTIPEAYGGMQIDPLAYLLVVEEFSRANAGLGIMVSVQNTLCATAISLFGNDEQKQAYLPRLASGELGAYSLTEPDAGTDATSIHLTATSDGDDYVLNGSKAFVTNAGLAKIFIVFCTTDPEKGAKGLSALIIEAGTEGFEVGKAENKMGIKTSDTRGLTFDDCRVPKANRLGEEGEGIKIALTILDHGRMGVAAQAIGIGEAAFKEARDYSKERKQFGHPICDFQAIAFKLADMRVKLDASRLMLDRAVRTMISGKRFSMQASEAKLFASEACHWVANQAVQIHGGYGYIKEYPVERYFRDVRITELYEGTSEAQRIVISRAILKDD